MAQMANKKTGNKTHPVVENKNKNVVQKTTQESSSIDVATLMKEMQQMKELIESQQKVINDLNKAAETKSTQAKATQSNFTFKKQTFQDSINREEIKIGGDEDIAVYSNSISEFCLGTLGFGNGKVYTFHALGDVIEIPYSDLKEIIHNNRSFIESGRVYINDERVIRKNRLEAYYEHMFKPSDFENMGNMAPKEFFDALIQMPKATETLLNKGNVPHQIDLVLEYVLDRSKMGKFPIELVPQLEQAYFTAKNRKIDISETIEIYHEIFDGKKE